MEDGPKISLVIPAWNEEEYLPRLLDTVDFACRQYHGGAEKIQVIVADNVSTDRTADVARSHGCDVVTVEQRCIAAVRNGGASAAEGELLCFVDADFQLHPDTFNYIDSVMENEAYVGGGTGVDMERWSLGLRVSWCLVIVPLRWFGLEAGVWFVRRTDFEALGGYDESLRYGEDVGFLTALKRLGQKRRPRQKLATRRAGDHLGLRPAFAICSTRKFDKYGDWHLLPTMAIGFFWLLFNRRRIDTFAQRYFYEDRAGDKPA